MQTYTNNGLYYCQWTKHPVGDVDAAVQKLKDKSAPWIAGILSSYRDIPGTNRWLTNGLPGEGWHQWGLAADCYCFENGKMVSSGDAPCYKFCAEQAVKMGLTAGFFLEQKDTGHVQGPSADSASALIRLPTYQRSNEVAVLRQERGGQLRAWSYRIRDEP